MKFVYWLIFWGTHTWYNHIFLPGMCNIFLTSRDCLTHKLQFQCLKYEKNIISLFLECSHLCGGIWAYKIFIEHALIGMFNFCSGQIIILDGSCHFETVHFWVKSA